MALLQRACEFRRTDGWSFLRGWWSGVGLALGLALATSGLAQGTGGSAGNAGTGDAASRDAASRDAASRDAAEYDTPSLDAARPHPGFVQPVGELFRMLAAPPAGLPSFPVARVAGADDAVFALGKQLFADVRLSGDGTTSCASCHRPDYGFGQAEPLAVGIGGAVGEFHAPSLFNRAWGKTQRWDGATESLMSFVLEPISSPRELGSNVEDALARLGQDAAIRSAFATAFGRDSAAQPSAQELALALAGYVEGLTLGDSPVDAFVQGEREAMTIPERAGMWIWESKGGCWQCHPRPLYTDELFHNTGIGSEAGTALPSALGRLRVTRDEADRGKFKTPTLRGVALHPPYMHDGSLGTLEDVVQFYRDGGRANPNLSPLMKPLDLTDQEAGYLVAFLRALSRTRVAATPGSEGSPR